MLLVLVLLMFFAAACVSVTVLILAQDTEEGPDGEGGAGEADGPGGGGQDGSGGLGGGGQDGPPVEMSVKAGAQGAGRAVAGPTTAGLSSAAAGADHTLVANGISIVFAKRLAGAVWTLQWKGHDFVGVTEGNGGSLQSALAYDVRQGESPEVENPTEAGNVRDQGGRTSSRWVQAAKSGSEIYTKTQMAYFIPPGEVVASSPAKSRARGRGVLSDTTMSKRVSIGYKSFKNVIRYVLQFDCPSPHWFTQIEVLTGYMPRAFTRMYTVENGKARAQAGPIYSRSPPAPAYPVIVAKSADVAMGIYADAAPRTGTYKQSPWYTVDSQTHGGHQPGSLQPVRFTKWNVVWHAGDVKSPGKGQIPRSFVFGVFLVVGTVDECAATIAALQQGA